MNILQMRRGVGQAYYTSQVEWVGTPAFTGGNLDRPQIDLQLYNLDVKRIGFDILVDVVKARFTESGNGSLLGFKRYNGTNQGGIDYTDYLSFVIPFTINTNAPVNPTTSTIRYYARVQPDGNAEGKIEVNNVVKKSGTATITTSSIQNNIYFINNGSNSTPKNPEMHVRYAQIYYEDKIIADLIPVRINVEGCFYDRVRNIILKKIDGTSNLIYGADV